MSAMDISSPHRDGPTSQPQGLPSIMSLTNGLSPQATSPLNNKQETRDSGAFSVSQQSKHSSAVSNPNLQINTILNADESPNRQSGPASPLSARVPSHHSGNLPSLNKPFEGYNRDSGTDYSRNSGADFNRNSGTDYRNSGTDYRNSGTDYRNSGTDYRSSGTDYRTSGTDFSRTSGITDYTPQHESRRSSIDSRMNSGMSHLVIGPSSPYNESQNASQVSLASNLQHQRGITSSVPPRSSGTAPLSPLSGRSSARSNQAPRIAPVINPNPRGVSGMPDPTAAAPTKGYAWAFPDARPGERAESRPVSRAPPPEPEPEISGRNSEDSSPERSLSRQGSFAASINSSLYTDPNLPPGQRRFDDDPATTHHHSMKHKAIVNLQGGDAMSPAGSGNYSRTPELRNSHKLAERKRRSEMKDLFDTLNEILPGGPSNKTSKWEILSKAIEHIKALDRNNTHSQAELQHMRPELDYARRTQNENDQLRHEVEMMYQQLRVADPQNPHVYGTMTGHLAQQQGQQQHHNSQTNGANGFTPSQPHTNGTAQNVLPPLQQQQSASSPGQWPMPPQTQPQPPVSGAPMQGVEMYGRTFERR
ncbi:hypothetical protein EV356DRAFT_512085 [Viridothelium virens]|uniref:BHLH domain-containing protein n=1 Tax=Viridothelium virens TaxID=1048519 RepID=A0A6A6GTC8_VIRVR|nr:hypothetical protein EV356DRAFT_512085 [Viridothelium virens]